MSRDCGAFHYVPTPYDMSSTHEVLPYSVSSGSAYGVFDKLQGAKNYVAWKNKMRIVLMSLRQWGVVSGSIVAPTPVDEKNMTPAEVKAQEAWEVREISAFMEISLRIADSALNVLGDTQNPKVAWGILQEHFGAKQDVLIAKLQLASWDGTESIHTHRDYMVGLRIQLVDAGTPLSDDSFYSYFLGSLPSSLDLLVTLYDNPTHDVDLLCDKIAKYEMRLKLRAMKSRKAQAAEGPAALFGQQTMDKEKRKKRDLSNVTCYDCGEKGHLKQKCPDKG